MEENGRTSAGDNAGRSVLDDEDIQAGYVGVEVIAGTGTAGTAADTVATITTATANRRSSPFASPTSALRTVQEGSQARAAMVVSPTARRNSIDEEVEVPRAHAEESFPSPRRRVTPTSRRSQNHRVTYEDLVSRPRSNPRSRTPMRYESPLEHGAFRNRDDNDDDDNESPQDAFQPRTISIRPNAGMGVGAVRAIPQRTHFDDTNTRPKPITLKSQKQGPSQRKTRRWNNDNFTNTYHDLANSSSAKGRAAAEVLAKAKADARHYLPVYDPLTDAKRSDKVTQFMEDKRYSDVRDRFFRGELHASTKPSRSHKETKKVADPANLSAAELFDQIEGRLRNVVVKACENSAPACKVVESFENYLIEAFSSGDDSARTASPVGENNAGDDFWEGILLEKPTVASDDRKEPTNGKNGRTVVFLFDGDSTSGGFHRLLVHAICHFHSLRAKTSTKSKARVLSVHGVMRGSQYRLLDHVMALQEKKQ